jgi:hypothetical protein
MKMKTTIRFALALCLGSFIASGQSADDEKAVTAVINKLFYAMQLGDSSMLHSTFGNDVTTRTIYKDKSGNVVLRPETLQDFLKAVGTKHQEVWYEEIWNLNVRIDGDFAQAWCDFAFYADNTFSHCGVDAFHLYRTKDGWKIFHLADTRRKTNCIIPQEIQDKHKGSTK